MTDSTQQARAAVTPEAMKAAAEAVMDASFGQELPEAPYDLAKAALEASARYIRAQALEEAADKVMGPSDVLLDAATCRWIATELRERAFLERNTHG